MKLFGFFLTKRIYRAVASTVRDQIMQKYAAAREERKKSKQKRLYYLSVEFLMGRSMYCNMLNLVSTKEYREALSELGIPKPASGVSWPLLLPHRSLAAVVSFYIFILCGFRQYSYHWNRK